MGRGGGCKDEGENRGEKMEDGGFGPHAAQLCKLNVSAASRVPQKKGDIYRRLAVVVYEPLLCHTHKYYHYYFMRRKKLENLSNLRCLQRQ